MSLDPQIVDMLGQTISYKARGDTTDGFGDPTFGALQTASARVAQKTETVVDDQGRQVETTHKILTEAALARGDRVWLPDGDTSKANDAYEVKVVQEGLDENAATTHYVVRV